MHREIKKKMLSFLKKNKNNEIVILDIPLLLENKINKKGDILIFVQSQRKLIIEKLKKRKNFNSKLVKKFKNVQLTLDYKKRKSQFIIKNDFKEKTVKKEINKILQKIL